MTEAMKTLTDGMVQIAQKQQTTRDALAKLFYRNAALNRSIPWGNEDEVPDTVQSNMTYTSTVATPGNPAAVTPEIKPVTQPQPEKKSNWASILPWALAALIGGGAAGYAINNWDTTEDPPVAEETQGSLLQYLEDEGHNVPPTESVR